MTNGATKPTNIKVYIYTNKPYKQNIILFSHRVLLNTTKLYINTNKKYNINIISKPKTILFYKVLLNAIKLYIITNKKYNINIMYELNIPLYRIQTHTPYFPKIKKICSKKKKPINPTTINKYHNHNTIQMASAYRPQINTLTKQNTYTQQNYKKYPIQTQYLYQYQHAHTYEYYDHFRKYQHEYHYQHQYKHQNQHPYRYTCQNQLQLKYQTQLQNQQRYQQQHQYALQLIYPQYQYQTQHQKLTTKALPTNTTKIQNIIPKQCLNYKTGSASRPRDINRNKYHSTNKWALRRITNHAPKNNANTHFFTKQLTNKIPALPNLFTTYKFSLTKYLKLNKRKPKTIQTQGYYFINELALLQCGDIESNPGPMPDILRTHPAIHKKRAKTYFIPNTIKLQPEYQHIASSFAPILKTNHPLHHQTNIKYPYLHQYIQTQNLSPSTHILYALIITINPSIDTCNNILAQPHTYDFNDIWTTTLLIRLTNLNNPPERHILTQHPYTTFVINNQDIINLTNSIHNELYQFIHNQEIPPTPIILQTKFPFLPEKLTT